MARQSRSLAVVILLASGVQVLRFTATFVGAARPALRSTVARRAYETGKVNLGSETDARGSAVVPPEPVIACDSSCMAAIEECVGDGCSVEAMMKLDEKLAADEKKIADQLEKLEQILKTDPVPAAVQQKAWLQNFLSRTASLRGQLVAMKPAGKANDFVKQLVRAASVAFGGGRETDYPKVGVSSFSG